MSGIRFAIPGLVLCALVSLTFEARGDSITINPNIVVERSYERPSDTEPLQLSRRDCEENAVIVYSVTIDAPRVRSMEIWIGDEACDSSERRGEEDCRLIASPTLGGGAQTIPLTAHEIIGEDCVGTQSNADPITLTLFFAFLGDNGAPNNEESTTETVTYDLYAADPPTFTELGEGDGVLVPRWDPLDLPDVIGYRFYCEKSAGAASSTTGGSAGAAGAGSAAACETSLVPDEIPDEALYCGEQAGQMAGRGTIEKLTNNQLYAVGVTTKDAVGNVGPLSNVLCQAPKEVTDFYEAYTQAGGQGGGGYCSFGHDLRSGAWSWLLLCGTTFELVRRRRRRS